MHSNMGRRTLLPTLLITVTFAMDRDHADHCTDWSVDIKEYQSLAGEPVNVRCALFHGIIRSNYSQSQASGLSFMWYKSHAPGEAEEPIDRWRSGDSLWFRPAHVSDSGLYTCVLRNSTYCMKVSMRLHVVPNATGLCYSPSLLYRQKAELGKSKEFSCPEMGDLVTPGKYQVSWFKECRNPIWRPMVQTRKEVLIIHDVQLDAAGNYTCRVLTPEFSFSRTTELIITAPLTQKPPQLIFPQENGLSIVEVYQGQTVSLTCQAYFGYSGGVSPSIYWMKGDSFIEELDPKRIYENETRVLHEWLGEQRVALRLVLNSVQPRDLGNYTCIVANGRGKRHGTVLLRQHEPPSVLQLAVGLSAMLLLLGAGVALYRCHRVELALCYRQHCGLDETRGDNKEYDAFVSCAKADGGAWGGEGAEDEHLALELIPDVLEKHFGFRLFLPERDLIPANTYVEDVSRAIELSRRLILLLTPSYVLRRGWSLFQIEEGLRTMLEGGQTKVIIIECGELRGVVNYHEVEALRAGIKSVVTVHWKGASSGHLGSHFWKKLRYAMPAKKPDTRGDSEPCLDEAEASPFQSLHTVAENVGPVTSLACRMDTRASVCNPCYARYGSGTRVARVFGETSPRILDNHHTYCNIPLSLVNGHRAKGSGAPFGSVPLATATLGPPRRDFAPEESQGNSAVLPLLPRAAGTSSVIW